MEGAKGLVLWLERLCEAESAQIWGVPCNERYSPGVCSVPDPLPDCNGSSPSTTGEVGLRTIYQYIGGFLHADDIRTLASSLDVLEAQVSLVQEFAKENFLKLNSRKQVTRMHLTQNAK